MVRTCSVFPNPAEVNLLREGQQGPWVLARRTHQRANGAAIFDSQVPSPSRAYASFSQHLCRPAVSALLKLDVVGAFPPICSFALLRHPGSAHDSIQVIGPSVRSCPELQISPSYPQNTQSGGRSPWPTSCEMMISRAA